jgi:hypothetical protein
LQRVKGGEKNQREKMQREGRDMQRAKGGGWGGLNVTLGLENVIFILVFFKCWLVEPVQFGSIGFRL